VKFPKGTWLFDPKDLIHAKELIMVEESVLEILNIAKQQGTLVIITNSEEGWIARTCRKFMPKLYPELGNLRHFSARTAHESPTLTLPMEWKVSAFKNEIERFFGKDAASDPLRRKNVVSIGDGLEERQAALRGASSFPNCQSKSLKLIEQPSIGDLRKQLSLLLGCLEGFLHHDGNLDLIVTSKLCHDVI